jgi:hypothetical protein
MLVPLHVDELATIDVWSKPLCVAVGCIAGAAGLALTVCFWHIAPPSGLRRSRPNLWRLSVIASALVGGAAASWLAAGLLGIGAQFLTGKRNAITGTVTLIAPQSSPRSLCDEHLWVRRDGEQKAVYVCLRTRWRPSLATATLISGQRVRMQLRQTPLGDVVESIDPAN